MLAHSLIDTWRRILCPRGTASHRVRDGQAAIHGYDPVEDFAARAHCRDRARFHLGRARRAKDRGDYRAAAREIERALSYDDTSEAYFQVLGQCHLHGPPPSPAAARCALERAFVLNPHNGYTAKLLLRAYAADGTRAAARAVLERALAGAPPDAPRPGALERRRNMQPLPLGA
jgi:tetratricopeptide (TPR) repeat protein